MSVSPNSKAVYHNEIKGDKEDSQAKVILKAMGRIGRACTMREIQEESGLEINAVSRSLNVLRTKDLLIDCFDAIAKVKGKERKVHHYFLVKKDGEQTGLFI